MPVKTISRSQYAERVFVLPEGHKLSYEGRSWARTIVDHPAPAKVLMAGRQVGKSVILAQTLATECAARPNTPCIYASPRERQTRDFSRKKLEPLLNSPNYKKNMVHGTQTFSESMGILDKFFTNGSSITLRYAYLTADTIRGNTAKVIAIDEIQDIMTDHIPVILECASSFPPWEKQFIYSGTSKTFETPLQEKFEQSTKCEWFLICGCGHEQMILRESLDLDTKCRDPKCNGHVICTNCGRLLDVNDGIWVATGDPKAPLFGCRVPQILNPFCDWHGEQGVVWKAKTYSEALFDNEVLGLPHESATRVFDEQSVRDCCKPGKSLEAYRTVSNMTPMFAGIDWGGNGIGTTCLAIGYFRNETFNLCYAKIWEGSDFEAQLEDIIKICSRYNCRIVGADYGNGHYQNKILVRRMSKKAQVNQYCYTNTGGQSVKVRYNKKSGFYRVHRTKTLDDVALRVKRGDVVFPRWEQMQPFWEHLKYVREDWTTTDEKGRVPRVYYDHPAHKPDDFFHALNYAMISGALFHKLIYEGA